MTDTDKLKRLAEAAHPHWYDVDIMLGGNPLSTGPVGSYIASFRPEAILALIAENEALNEYGKNVAQEAVQCRKDRDEAVALLRDAVLHCGFTSTAADISAFLARIDAAE